MLSVPKRVDLGKFVGIGNGNAFDFRASEVSLETGYWLCVDFYYFNDEVVSGGAAFRSANRDLNGLQAARVRALFC